MNRRSALIRHWVDGVLLAGLSLAALYPTARIGMKPRDPANGVAVIFAPWTAPDVALLQATTTGGRFVRFGGLPFIVIVIPEDLDYTSRIIGSGAWLVLDPQVLAACVPAFTSTAQNQ